MEHLDTIITIIVILAGQIYSWGKTSEKIASLEDDFKTYKKDHKDTETEVFNRLRCLEGITPRIEDTSMRLERMLNNGVSHTVHSIDRRLSVLEKHCEDMHGGSPQPVSRETDCHV